MADDSKQTTDDSQTDTETVTDASEATEENTNPDASAETSETASADESDSDSNAETETASDAEVQTTESSDDSASDDAGDAGTSEAEEEEQQTSADEPAGDAKIVGSVIQPATSGPVTLSGDGKAASTLQASDLDAQHLDLLKARLDTYAAKMGRAVPVTPEQGAIHQAGLWRHLKEILSLEGSKFTKAWTDLLAKVHEERDSAFHEIRAFRFIDRIKQFEQKEARAFGNLLHLIINTADPKGRQTAMKSIDLASVAKDVPVANAVDKLHSYYTP